MWWNGNRCDHNWWQPDIKTTYKFYQCTHMGRTYEIVDYFKRKLRTIAHNATKEI